MIEIERKFLVTSDAFRPHATAVRHIQQGYLSTTPEATVRLRIADDLAYITIKSKNHGAARNEWEYPIPLDDARQMMQLCGTATITKDRYIIPTADGLKWEVDVFHGRHEGLILAEIELPTADHPITLPPYIGTEVTHDPRYYNSTLSLS